MDPRLQRIGDVITQVDGRSVRTIAEFADVLAEAGIGNPVTLTVTRDGRRRSVRIVVADIS